jgi:hypothetical protein
MIEGGKRNKFPGAFISFPTRYHFLIEGGKRNKCTGNLFLFPPSIILIQKLKRASRNAECTVVQLMCCVAGEGLTVCIAFTMERVVPGF